MSMRSPASLPARTCSDRMRLCRRRWSLSVASCIGQAPASPHRSEVHTTHGARAPPSCSAGDTIGATALQHGRRLTLVPSAAWVPNRAADGSGAQQTIMLCHMELFFCAVTTAASRCNRAPSARGKTGRPLGRANFGVVEASPDASDHATCMDAASDFVWPRSPGRRRPRRSLPPGASCLNGAATRCCAQRCCGYRLRALLSGGGVGTTRAVDPRGREQSQPS